MAARTVKAPKKATAKKVAEVLPVEIVEVAPVEVAPVEVVQESKPGRAKREPKELPLGVIPVGIALGLGVMEVLGF